MLSSVFGFGLVIIYNMSPLLWSYSEIFCCLALKYLQSQLPHSAVLRVSTANGTRPLGKELELRSAHSRLCFPWALRCSPFCFPLDCATRFSGFSGCQTQLCLFFPHVVLPLRKHFFHPLPCLNGGAEIPELYILESLLAGVVCAGLAGMEFRVCTWSRAWVASGL